MTDMDTPSSSPLPFYIPVSRRVLLRSLMLTTAGLWVPGAFAEALTVTPALTEGPYFPDQLPLDQDNDLVRLSDGVTPAIGTITNVRGRVLDKSGQPLKGALVELWQADDHGCYLHSNGEDRNKKRDPGFQGYGKFETASDGGWRFRTIKPGLYTGRARHFHFSVTLPRQRKFTTQLLFAGEPENERDMVFRQLKTAELRAAIAREFKPDPDTKELAADWDIIMGHTPSDEQRPEKKKE